jgi:secreted PhoX family phosphatase
MEHPGGLLDLPKGFAHVVLQRAGMPMSDGHAVPPQPDGMGCFAGPDGQLVLLRNQEIGNRDFLRRYGLTEPFYRADVVPEPRVSADQFGGVSRLVVDTLKLERDLDTRPGEVSSAVIRSHMALAGTDSNCAGGVVPEGWVSCEESSADGHGYAFLTRPEDEALGAPRRIDSWGRFHREAVALDPGTGIVYMTEDRSDACFYRHVPEDPAHPMGPGRLEALSIPGLRHTDPYPPPTSRTLPAPVWRDGQSWDVQWVAIPDRHARQETCRAQAARLGATGFTRTEGITRAGRDIWFLASTAGPMKAGQIYRYSPGGDPSAGGLLTLELEVRDRTVLSSPDNTTVAPWGDLILAEDNYNNHFGAEHQYLRGLTLEGQVYDIARNRDTRPAAGSPGAEFTGVCFSPDGRFLFANMQDPVQLTIAIRGPWTR